MAGAIGCAAAIDWLDAIGVAAAAAHEHALLEYGTRRLSEVPGLRIIGTAPHKAAILSFVMDGAHPQDIGSVLDMEGVAIRTGHHFTMPLMERFHVQIGRASFRERVCQYV